MVRIDRNNPLPLYVQLREALRSEILGGQRMPGDNLPFEYELCRTYGISRITVKHALKDLAEDGLLDRIKGKGTFVRGQARIEKTSRTETKEQKTFAFIHPDVSDIFIPELYRGMESVASENGYRIVMLSADRKVEREVQNIQILRERDEEGAIIFPFWGRANAEEIFELKREGFPFVLLDRFFRDIKTDSVSVDNFSGAYSAVKHLISLGHRRIGHISGTQCTANEDRIEGYKEALAKASIVYVPELVKSIAPFESEGSRRFEPDDIGGYKTMKEFLRMEERPTAIFAGNDYLALGAFRAIKEKGMRVGEDIALVGFDDLKFAETLEVPLTTVSQPKFRIGRSAARILIEKINAKREGRETQLKQVVLKTKLIVRQSCGHSVGMKKAKERKPVVIMNV